MQRLLAESAAQILLLQNPLSLDAWVTLSRSRLQQSVRFLFFGSPQIGSKFTFGVVFEFQSGINDVETRMHVAPGEARPDIY